MSDDRNKDEDEEKPVADVVSIHDAPKKPKKPKKEKDDEDEDKIKQADQLIAIAKLGAQFFHDADQRTFADIQVGGHRETWKIASTTFRRWLLGSYYAAYELAPSSEAVKSAVNVLEAVATFKSEEREVTVRVGGDSGKIYVDLCRPDWKVVEIGHMGWKIVANPPHVRFVRSSGMLKLPAPVRGGSIDDLREFLNVPKPPDDDHFNLVVAWLLAAYRPSGPYPVLVLTGEQGSAKSTLSKVLRSLVDPNTAALRSLPRNTQDLYIAANNGHALVYDNVSRLQPWLSDTLCCLATGGGFAVRALYKDLDEIIFDAQRPIILNGIEDIVSRPDLADRGLFIHLTAIPDDRRKPEKDLWAHIGKRAPLILGALFDAVACGLREIDHTTLETLPRMADFCLWSTACFCDNHVNENTFIDAYTANRAETVDNVIEADPVASALKQFVTEQRGEWAGTKGELLKELRQVVGDKAADSKTFPQSARALGGRVRRAATFLRKIGLDIEDGARAADGLTVILKPTDEFLRRARENEQTSWTS